MRIWLIVNCRCPTSPALRMFESMADLYRYFKVRCREKTTVEIFKYLKNIIPSKSIVPYSLLVFESRSLIIHNF